MLKSAADATQLLFQETGFYEVLALLKNQRIQVTYRFHSTPAQPSVHGLGKSVRETLRIKALNGFMENQWVQNIMKRATWNLSLLLTFCLKLQPGDKDNEWPTTIPQPLKSKSKARSRINIHLRLTCTNHEEAAQWQEAPKSVSPGKDGYAKTSGWRLVKVHMASLSRWLGFGFSFFFFF